MILFRLWICRIFRIEMYQAKQQIYTETKEQLKTRIWKYIAKNGELVIVHLREEESKKDKILFLISTFYKKKTSPL